MITLSTPNKELMNELYSDQDKAMYWFIKQHGGNKKYEQMRDEMLYRAKREAKDIISDIVEYKSPNNNKWMVFEAARYYKDANSSFTNLIAICYYETIGSTGVFVPTVNDINNKEKCCLIFNSHFFYQMAQRMKLTTVDKAVVRRFLEYIPSFVFQVENLPDGRKRIDVKLPGSIGRGFLRDGDNFKVYEVRTFLKDKQLSGSQKRVTKKLRDNSDLYEFEPDVIRINKMKHLSKEEKMDVLSDNLSKIRKRYELAGGDTNFFDQYFSVIILLSMAYTKQNLLTDTSCFEHYASDISTIVTKYIDNEVDIYYVADKIAKIMRLKKYSPEQFRNDYADFCNQYSYLQK